MTGNDFIQLAAKLAVSRPHDTAAMRTAIARAYYGSFHLAEDTLRACGVSLESRRHDRHQILRDSGHPAAIRAGHLLGDLQGYRVKADYRMQIPEVEEPAVATRCVEMAVTLQSLLVECNTPEARRAIREGIEASRRKVSGG